MRAEATSLPHATRPLTDGHRALLRMLAEAFVNGQIGPDTEQSKAADGNLHCTEAPNEGVPA